MIVQPVVKPMDRFTALILLHATTSHDESFFSKVLQQRFSVAANLNQSESNANVKYEEMRPNVSVVTLRLDGPDLATEMMAYNNVCMRGRGVTDLFVIVTAVYRVFQKIITDWHKAENWIRTSMSRLNSRKEQF